MQMVGISPPALETTKASLQKPKYLIGLYRWCSTLCGGIVRVLNTTRDELSKPGGAWNFRHGTFPS